MQILDGAISAVSEQGVGPTTHRAVAKSGGVSLSTTTYYFTSLDDLLCQAFLRLIDKTRPVVDARVEAYQSAIENSKLTPASPVSDRIVLRDQLVDVILSLTNQMAQGDEWAVLLRAEMRFVFEGTHVKTLSDELRHYRSTVSSRLAILPRMLGSDQPEVDANILYDLLLLAEYDSLVLGHDAMKREQRARFERVLGWIFKI
jgi:AcrR family transcriptional regulator